jgi:hypothetical protein
MPIVEGARVLGLLYAIVIVFLVPLLLLRGRFTLPARIGLTGSAILSGFPLFSPMTPVMQVNN